MVLLYSTLAVVLWLLALTFWLLALRRRRPPQPPQPHRVVPRCPACGLRTVYRNPDRKPPLLCYHCGEPFSTGDLLRRNML